MTVGKILLLVVLAVVLVLLAPLAVVWSLNILFPELTIPYTLETWLAVVVLASAIRANVSVKK
jgi:hypothetical protein